MSPNNSHDFWNFLGSIHIYVCCMAKWLKRRNLSAYLHHPVTEFRVFLMQTIQTTWLKLAIGLNGEFLYCFIFTAIFFLIDILLLDAAVVMKRVDASSLHKINSAFSWSGEEACVFTPHTSYPSIGKLLSRTCESLIIEQWKEFALSLLE